MNRFAILCFVLTTSVAGRALAASAAEGDAPPEAPAPRTDLRLTVDSGVFSDSHLAGFVLGGEVLFRRGLLAAGAVAEVGSSLGFVAPYSYWGGGGGAGISLPTPSWLRIDLLGIVGVHRYEGVHGAGFPAVGLVSDPGVSATLPSLGARGGITFELGGRARFVIGLKAALDRDIGSSTRSHVRQILFSPSETVTTEVGGLRGVGLLTLGASIGG